MTEPPGRVDVEVDVLLRVLGLEEQQLGDDQVGDVVVDRRAEEDDAVLEQARVDVVGALAAAGLLDDDRDRGWRSCGAVTEPSGFYRLFCVTGNIFDAPVRGIDSVLRTSTGRAPALAPSRSRERARAPPDGRRGRARARAHCCWRAASRVDLGVDLVVARSSMPSWRAMRRARARRAPRARRAAARAVRIRFERLLARRRPAGCRTSSVDEHRVAAPIDERSAARRTDVPRDQLLEQRLAHRARPHARRPAARDRRGSCRAARRAISHSPVVARELVVERRQLLARSSFDLDAERRPSCRRASGFGGRPGTGPRA